MTQKTKNYGRVKIDNPQSAFHNQEFTLQEYVTWRDGSRSAWVIDDDNFEMSFRESDTILLEVFTTESTTPIKEKP